MAEAVFRSKVAAAGLSDKIAVDSAGTGDWHVGKPPHHGTRRVLEENRIDGSGMTARQIARADLDTFDYVLTMDNQNLADVRALACPDTRARIRPLLEYASGGDDGPTEVPDPYYTGGYEGVYRLIDAACDGLLATLRREHGI